MNDYPGAAGHFGKAIALGDSSAFAFKYAGIAHYLNASFPEAIRFLSVASELDSTDAEVHFFLITSLAGTTRKEEAMFHLERSLELIRPDPAVIARIYSEQGNIMCLEMEYENTYALYRRAWYADTTNPMALYYMASILDNSLHRSREAMSDYTLFLEKFDRMPPEASEKYGQLPTIREIVKDRIESLREELFFLDQRE
jgi:tetratricopeptide (TPR) repeat protein